MRAVALEIFQGTRRTAERPGLHRLERLWPGEDPPLDGIKITGSNGKGSVAHGTAVALQEMGLRIGLYTSPHLRSFAERFVVDGRPVSPDLLASAMDRLRPRLRAPWSDPDDPPLAFEVMTALGAEIFTEAGVDVVVAEVGIGGRRDPVRRFPGPVSVLVSVDLEHTSLLGHTLEAIALDKAEIAADGTCLLTGLLPPGPAEAVARACERRGVEVVPMAPLPEGPDLLGTHPRQNAALAAEAALRWVEARRSEIPEAVRLAAVRTARSADGLPCRMEKVSADPEIWVDVAHTPAALRAVADAVGRLRPLRPLTVVLGISGDKEGRIPEMIEPLAGSADRFVCTRARHRSGRVEPLVRAVEQLCSEKGRVAKVLRFEDLGDALAHARSAASAEGGRVLVTGGFFLAVEAAEIVAGRDPSDLYFY